MNKPLRYMIVSCFQIAIGVILILPAVGIAREKTDSRVVRGKATVTLDQNTLAQAKEEALRRALADAQSRIQQEITSAYAQTILSSESKDSSSRYQSFARFTRSVTRGRVIDYEIISQGMIETIAKGQAGRPALYAWETVVDATVELDVGEPDPGFEIRFSLNRTAFTEADFMSMSILATKDCYVTIFNLYSNDSLRVVFPNSIARNNFVEANKEVLLPPKNSGWKLRPTLLPERESDFEALLVVATKDNVPFRRDSEVAIGELTSMGEAITAINRWLVDIDAGKRTTADVSYRVYR